MRALTILLILAAGPAMAATGPFFSLKNTNFVVLIAFVLFVLVLLYVKVPGLLGGLLDKRAATIKAELDEAKALKDEAQAILAGYERKRDEVAEQSQKIVDRAKVEAEQAAADAKAALEASIARRLRAAEDQIASAQATAVREVRDRAIEVAVAAASEVLASDIDDKARADLIDASISEVRDRLH